MSVTILLKFKANQCTSVLDTLWQRGVLKCIYSIVIFIGRRASDGLVTQAVIAFRQKLQDTMKTPGMLELRQEHQKLQNQFPTNLTDEEISQV